jgi:hypothetical protein
VCILIAKHPELAIQLLHYVNTICSASKLNTIGWKNITNISGKKFHNIQIQNRQILMLTNLSSNPPNKQNHCYKFNGNGFCSKPGCQNMINKINKERRRSMNATPT